MAKRIVEYRVTIKKDEQGWFHVVELEHGVVSGNLHDEAAARNYIKIHADQMQEQWPEVEVKTVIE